MAICLLVRHGASTGNSDGVLSGWQDVGLTDGGRAAAEALGERLVDVPITRVVTSPLRRCRETLDAILSGRELASTVDDELGECRYGAWTGRPLGELAEEPLWTVVQDRPSEVRFPESTEYAAESLAEMSARAVAAVRRHDAAVEEEHGENAVWMVVSHGDVIKAILADAVATSLDEFQRFVVAPASLSVVRYTARRPFLLRANDTGPELHITMPSHVPTTDGVVGGGD